MKCPLCGNVMITGKLFFKVPWPGGIRLYNNESSSIKHTIMRFFKDKNTMLFQEREKVGTVKIATKWSQCLM